MNPDNLASLIPHFLLKGAAVSILVLHLLFSILIARQTQVMTKVVRTRISPLIFILSLVHLLSSIFVLVWVVLFL